MGRRRAEGANMETRKIMMEDARGMHHSGSLICVSETFLGDRPTRLFVVLASWTIEGAGKVQPLEVRWKSAAV